MMTKTDKFTIMVGLLSGLLTITPAKTKSETHSFEVEWDPNPIEENVTSYEGYLSSSFAAAKEANIVHPEILDFFDVSGEVTQGQFTFDDLESSCVYATIVAKNSMGLKSDYSAVLCYHPADIVTQKNAPNCGAIRIDGVDLTFIGLHFGEYTDGNNDSADINKDGRIDGLDLALIGINFGETCQTQ